MDTITHCILFILCLLLGAFYEGAGVAFLYSFRYREKDKHSSGLQEKVLAGFYRMPGTFLLAARLVTLLSLLAGLAMGHDWLSDVLVQVQTDASLPVELAVWSLLLVVSVMTVFFVPRAVCGRNPDKSLKAMSFLLYMFGILLYPLTRLLSFPARALSRLMGVVLDEKSLSHLLAGKELVESKLRPVLSVEKPDIEEKDMKLFRNALEFSNIRVHDCIVPRTEIVAVELHDSIEELIGSFVKSGKTKIIVYQEDLDHIVGYVHSSEMFRVSAREDWTKSIRQIPIVPESMTAQKMMQIFMQQKKSIAVVADEFGGTSGIISLEDLVEEIFGDIEDEHDTITYTARKIGEHEYLLSARLEIEKVNEQFNLSLPESDDYLTVGGFILYHHQAFPKSGEVVTIGCFSFSIIKTSISKIELVKLKVMG